MIQGMGGIMDLTGEPDGEPQKIGVAFADIFTGVYSVVGVLAALRRRDQTGQGAHLDMALLDVQTSVLANQAMNYLASGQAPRRMGNAHPNIVPYQVFPVADGHVIVAVGNDGQFARFVAVLGRPELAQDERFRTNAGRVRHRLELVPVLTELTLKVDPRRACCPPSRPKASRPARSIRWPTCSPIRRSSRGACGSICPRRRQGRARSRPCARPSCSTASRWRPSARRRASGSIRRKS